MNHVGRRVRSGRRPWREVATLPSRPIQRVWMLNGALYAAALAIYVAFVRPHFAEPHGSTAPWPVLAVGFALTELKVVDVHFRRERHSFSLSEVPLVVGLFMLTPMDYVIALVVGSAAALVIESRVRRSFNLGNIVLCGLVSLAIFHAALPGHVPADLSAPSPWDWLVTSVATAAGAGLQTTMVATVITISGGAPQFRRLGSMLQFAIMVALANTSLALLAVVVLATHAQALVLLTIPTIVIFFAYRAYVSERVKHERLELLYESSRILQHSPELDASVFALVEHARDMFRAEIAQLVIFPDRAAGQALSTTSVHEGPEERMAPSRPAREPAIWARVRSEARPFLWEPAPGETIAGIGLRQAMVSPMTGESEPLGMMLVANRLAEGTEFDREDLRLLETVANQVGIALENGQLERSLSELSRLKEELRYQAFHDALTGLPNRALFAEQVERRLVGRGEGDEPVVMFLDLDDFKLVNDTLGHAMGDRLLIAVADRIRACVRGTDLAARLGGDEFGILLSEGDGMVEALAIADRLVETLRAPFPIDGQDILVGASVGVAAGRSDTRRADDLLRNADVAMYTAKSGGKRRVAVFDPLLHEELRSRQELSAELSRSLGRGELQVHYQPVIELARQRIVGVEALVRWRHRRRGFVPPDEFVRLAEENGTIEALGAFVLEEACRQTAEWRRRMDDSAEFSVNVNVSPRQLQQPGFSAAVQATLARTGLAPRFLVLEMTETGMLQDIGATITKLRELQALGVRIAMDDFGTGYSSLSYLRRFPIDILKIARDFVPPDDFAAVPGEDPWAFARAIVALGQTLRLAIVAEGVETATQLDRLVELRCELGQGYWFGRPMPPLGLEAQLVAAGLLPGHAPGPLSDPSPSPSPSAWSASVAPSPSPASAASTA